MALNPCKIGALALTIRSAHLVLLLLLDASFPDYDTSKTLVKEDTPAPSTPYLDENALYKHRPSVQASMECIHLGGHLLHHLASTAKQLNKLFEGLLVWDSVYFTSIARHGYDYEQFYAFFPFMPALSGLLGGPAWFPLVSHVVSLLSSVLMAVLFAKLSEQVLQHSGMATKATLLLLLGQACLFHTVAYTESLFGALTMAGLYCLYCLPGSSTDCTSSASVPAAPAVPVVSTSLGHTPCPSPKHETILAPNRLSFDHLMDPGIILPAHRFPRSRTEEGSTGLSSSRAQGHGRWWNGSLLGACLAFTLASCTRSNGIINCGYLLHHTLENSLAQWQRGHARAAGARLVAGLAASVVVMVPLVAFQMHGYANFCCPSGRSSSGNSGMDLMIEVLKPLLSWASGSGVCMAAGLGAVGSEGSALGMSHGAILGMHDAVSGDAAGAMRPWCQEKLPRIYPFVQEHYWGLGFLKYWTWRQLPNFALAAPTLLLAAAACFTYAASNAKLLLLGGLLPLSTPDHQQPLQKCHKMPDPSDRPPDNAAAGSKQAWHDETPDTIDSPGSCSSSNSSRTSCSGSSSSSNSSCTAVNSSFLGPAVAVHLYPYVFMAAYSMVAMHVQVATRFVSCCPIHYWFMAHLMTPGQAKEKGTTDATALADVGCQAHKPGRVTQQRLLQLLIWGCCLGYTALGSLLFPNFYPWT